MRKARTIVIAVALCALGASTAQAAAASGWTLSYTATGTDNYTLKQPSACGGSSTQTGNANFKWTGVWKDITFTRKDKDRKPDPSSSSWGGLFGASLVIMACGDTVTDDCAAHPVFVRDANGPVATFASDELSAIPNGKGGTTFAMNAPQYKLVTTNCSAGQQSQIHYPSGFNDHTGQGLAVSGKQIAAGKQISKPVSASGSGPDEGETWSYSGTITLVPPAAKHKKHK